MRSKWWIREFFQEYVTQIVRTYLKHTLSHSQYCEFSQSKNLQPPLYILPLPCALWSPMNYFCDDGWLDTDFVRIHCDMISHSWKNKNTKCFWRNLSFPLAFLTLAKFSSEAENNWSITEAVLWGCDEAAASRKYGIFDESKKVIVRVWIII